MGNTVPPQGGHHVEHLLPRLSDDARLAWQTLRSTLRPRDVAALGHWLGFFYPFQLEWLLCFHRFALYLKARQTGITHTNSACAVLYGAFLGETTTIVSKSDKDSANALLYGAQHCGALKAMGAPALEGVVANKRELRFASGGRALALSAPQDAAGKQGSGGRGYAGNVFLDEFGFHSHPGATWDAAAPATTHGYRLRVNSTPNGVGNDWHQLWTDPKRNAGFKLFSVTVEQAVEQGMPVDVKGLWTLSKNDPRVFAQNYQCSFLDGELQYIPTDAVDACRRSDTWVLEGHTYAGLDIGRVADRTELVVVRVDPRGVRWVLHRESCKRTSPEDIERLVRVAFSRPYVCKRLCVDATGMGSFEVDRMQRDYGKHRVERVDFNLKSKETLATHMYSMFTSAGPLDPETGEPERGLVRIPADDDQLKLDVCAIRREVTRTNQVRYDAPRNEHGHADSAWALALALHAAAGPTQGRLEIASVG